MRILWVKMGGLWPLNTGGRQRSFQLLSELSRRHEVAVVTTNGPGDDPAALARQLSRCERVVSVPFAASKQGSARFLGDLGRSWMSAYPADLWRWRVPAVRRLVEQLITDEPFDVVVSDFLVSVANLPRGTKRAPIAFFEHNVEYLIWKRLAEVEPRWWKRGLLELEWRKLRRCEIRAVEQSDMTIAVSETDRARLAAHAPRARTAAIATGVDIDYFQQAVTPQIPARLVFSGSMDWYPNEDAMLFWAESVLPRVEREVPNVTLTIVGRNPGPRVRALAERRGITVTGTVDDVRPHIADASLYIVPLRVGGGTRLKIFEALAMGKAVLSTTVGAEGLALVPGLHAEIADGADAFSRAVVDLLKAPGRRDALAREGRRLVEERYAWPRVAEDFERLLCEASGRAPAPAAAAEYVAHQFTA